MFAHISWANFTFNLKNKRLQALSLLIPPPSLGEKKCPEGRSWKDIAFSPWFAFNKGWKITGDVCLIPGAGRSPGAGHGNPFQYSCLENPMDIEAWWTIVHRVAKSQTLLKWLSTHAQRMIRHFPKGFPEGWKIQPFPQVFLDSISLMPWEKFPVHPPEIPILTIRLQLDCDFQLWGFCWRTVWSSQNCQRSHPRQSLQTYHWEKWHCQSLTVLFVQPRVLYGRRQDKAVNLH